MSTADRSHQRGPFEVLLHDDKSIDEILLRVGGECVMHVEQLSDRCFWMGLYAEGKTLFAHFGSTRGDMHVNAEWWDDEGEGDDTESFGFDEVPVLGSPDTLYDSFCEARILLKRCRKLLASHGAMKTAIDIDAFLAKSKVTKGGDAE